MAGEIMEARQLPLAKRYEKDPARAWVTDCAWTRWRLDDPLHGSVVMGPDGNGPYPIAVHEAVGGDGDGPVPGDILCAALASCLDSTIRVVADRLRLRLRALSVRATAEVDVRGTLCLAPDVPVAFQRMTVEVGVELDEGAAPRMYERLLQTAEHCCVVFQTLRRALPVELQIVPGPSASAIDEPPRESSASGR